jgi:hypothetical protein
MMRQQRYRLYLDLCEGGDLLHAINNRLDPWRINPTILPEGFLWHVFSSRVDACLTLQRGDAPPGVPRVCQSYGTAHRSAKFTKLYSNSYFFGILLRYVLLIQDPDWKPITHLDINLCNILLDKDNGNLASNLWLRWNSALAADEFLSGHELF